MQKVVAFVERQVPAALLNGAETGVVDLPCSSVLRQNPRHKLKGAARVFAHCGADGFHFGADHQTAHLVDGGFIGYILMKAAGVLGSAHQRASYGNRNIESAVGKKENVALLQYFTKIGGFFCGYESQL